MLLVRYWWILIGFTFILLIWHGWPLVSILRSGMTGWYMDLNHTYIWPIFLTPVKLFMLVTAVLWGMMVWWDESPDRRSSFWTMPVSRLTHHTARIIPGAVLLLIIYLVIWYSELSLQPHQ